MGTTFINVEVGRRCGTAVTYCTKSEGGALRWRYHVDAWRQALTWGVEQVGGKLIELDPGTPMGRGARLVVTCKALCVAAAKWLADHTNCRAHDAGDVVLSASKKVISGRALKLARDWHRKQFPEDYDSASASQQDEESTRTESVAPTENPGRWRNRSDTAAKEGGEPPWLEIARVVRRNCLDPVDPDSFDEHGVCECCGGPGGGEHVYLGADVPCRTCEHLALNDLDLFPQALAAEDWV